MGGRGVGRVGRRWVLRPPRAAGRELSMLDCWAFGNGSASRTAIRVCLNGSGGVSGVLRAEEGVGLYTASSVLLADVHIRELVGAGRVRWSERLLPRRKSRCKVAVETSLIAGIRLDQRVDERMLGLGVECERGLGGRARDGLTSMKPLSLPILFVQLWIVLAVDDDGK